jgi:transposase
MRVLAAELARVCAEREHLAGEQARLTRERDAARQERDEYRKLYELVTLELERIKRHLRAQNKSERVDTAQVQLALTAVLGTLDVPPALVEQITAEENARRERAQQGKAAESPRRGHGRRPLPDHLPVERIEVHPPESLRTCACCGTTLRRIGEETSERLDWRPGSFVRVQTARIKYACGCEEGGVTLAEPPASPVERGRAGPGLLAHVAIRKFEEAMPLHRLAASFARDGVDIPTSTLGDWVAQTADLGRPIVAAQVADMLRAHRIHTDDTGIPVLAKGGVHRGHVWVYIADEDHVLFRYTPRRTGDGPHDFLRGFTGYVQADAANLYDRLFRPAAAGDSAAIEVGCWAHARRKFVEAELTDRHRAQVALGFIKELYRIDAQVRDLSLAERTVVRGARAGPVLAAFRTWLDAEALVVLPKAPIAAALGYVRNQWDALTRFCEDGRLRLDNNAAERALRRVAVGRKNWLFAGSEAGAERACVLYSLLASCRLHGVHPFDYLRDILVRVSSHPARDVLALTPKYWKQKLQHLDAP